MITAEDTQAHYLSSIHRVRLWCDAHHVQDVDHIDWLRLWNDVARDNKWSDLPGPLSAAIEGAMREAKEAFECGLPLFPEGWDKNPAHR